MTLEERIGGWDTIAAADRRYESEGKERGTIGYNVHGPQSSESSKVGAYWVFWGIQYCFCLTQLMFFVYFGIL